LNCSFGYTGQLIFRDDDRAFRLEFARRIGWMFWAVVKCNLRDPSAVEAFNEWYNTQHAPRYIAQPGFRRGWRLERFDQTGQRGTLGQRFVAGYEVESTAVFNAALERDLTTSHPWEEWETRIKDWQRTYYRSLLSFGGAQPARGGKGCFWTIVRVDVDGLTSEAEREFNSWYDYRHIPQICGFAGFRRAWRLKLEPDTGDLGPRGQKYMAVYETDFPEYLPNVRRGTVPWDGIWGDHIRNWEVGFYQKLHDYEERATA
jgi:hypothetical protein